MSSERLGSATAWLAVGALVLSAHVAAAAWAMRQPGEAMPAAPDAIHMDLAPPPPGEASAPADASEEAAEAETPPEPEPAPEPEPEPEPEPVPDFTPEPVEPLPPPDFAALVPPEPVPDFVPPPVVPLPPPDFASLTPPPAEPAIVPPPLRRPERLVRREPEKPREEPKREEPKREARREPDQPRTERREQSQASRQGNQGASGKQGARQNSSSASGASKKQQATWQQRAGATVSKHMSRTRLPPGTGVVQATIMVSVSPSGATQARLTRGTGDPKVDAALSRQASRMPKLSPPPSGESVSFEQPIAVR